MSERKGFFEPVVDKIAETAFSANIEPWVKVGRKVLKEKGISEEELLRKAAEYLPYAAFAPLLGHKIGKDIKKGFKKRRKIRRGRGRSKRR